MSIRQLMTHKLLKTRVSIVERRSLTLAKHTFRTHLLCTVGFGRNQCGNISPGDPCPDDSSDITRKSDIAYELEVRCKELPEAAV